MHPPPVVGEPARSKVLLIGQAPGNREPVAGRPFAWTAGRKLFRWWHEATGLDEATVRARVYFAAVCRCFPGKKPTGGDRVPAPDEIANCRPWLEAEVALLRPALLVPVGKLAITQVLGELPLQESVGQLHTAKVAGHAVDVLPLPHPSGASPWPHREPGKTLLAQALALLAAHPAVRALEG